MAELIKGVLTIETKDDANDSLDEIHMSALFKKKSEVVYTSPLSHAVPIKEVDLSEKTGMLYIKTKDKETFLSINTWYKSLANSKISTLKERVDIIQARIGGHGDFSIYYKPTGAVQNEVTRIYYDVAAGKCDAKLPTGEWDHEYVVCCGGEMLTQGVPTNLVVFTRKL